MKPLTPTPKPPTEWDALIELRLRQVAKSVGDLALALNTHSARLREDGDEMKGLMIGILSELRKPEERQRRDSSDDSKAFPLPGKGNSITLSLRTRKQIIERSGKIALALVLWLASILYAYLGLPRPEAPAVAHSAHERRE